MSTQYRKAATIEPANKPMRHRKVILKDKNVFQNDSGLPCFNVASVSVVRGIGYD